MKGGQLANYFFAVSKQVANIDTIHSEKHIFKTDKVQKPSRKHFISCTNQSNDLTKVILNIFGLITQTILMQSQLILNVLIVLLNLPIALLRLNPVVLSLLLHFGLFELFLLFQLRSESFIDSTYDQFYGTRLIVFNEYSSLTLLYYFI